MKKLLALLMAVAVTFQLVTPVFADTEGTEEATAPTEAVVETKAPTEAPAEETTAPTEETTAPTEETSAPTEATEETEEATEETVEDIDLFADNGDMIASGECGKNGNNLTWVLTGDGTLTISGSGEMENYTDSSVAPWYSNRTKILSAVVEPGVESVGNYAFYACLKLASVSLPGGVKSIGESAFQDCAKLTAVEIPEGVTSIDYQTFYGCSSLTSVTIPDSVTSIGGDAFNGCSNLTSVMIPGSVTSIGGDAFRDCDGLTSVTIPEGVTSIGGGAFEDCSNLINVTIPKGVTKIGIYAFYACSSLTSVTIPEGVTDIGDATFMYCSNLTDVTIPGSVTSIGEFAFEGCNSLINMTIPESVTSISGYAFSGCGSLTSVTIPGRVTGIGGYAFFGCSNLTDVTILEGVIGIGGYAFGGCRSLTSVTIPRSVTSISEGAFDVCNQLKDVYYGGSDTQWKRVRIGDSNNCLTGATIHYNPVHVHDLLLISNRAASCMKAGCNAYYICYDCKKAFKDADGKTETTAGAEALPALGHDMAKTEAVEPTYWNVGNNAYYTCSRCGKVFKDANGETETTVEDETLVMLPSIAYGTCGDEGDNLIWVLTEDGTLTISGSGEMKNYSDSSVAPWYSNRTKILSAVVESGVTSIGDYAFYACLKLNSVTLHGDVKSIGGYVFQDCTKLTAVEIPEGVTSIGYRAFAGCSGLTSVTIPESVTSIGSGAFYDCSSLTGVTIPKGVTSIASAIFHGCSRLTSVTIPEGVTSIGGSAFYGCSNLTSVTIPEGVVSLGYFAFHGCSSLTSVTIPEGVPSIGDHVFYGCSKLTSVVIPEGVTSIGSSAFAGCSSLTSVTIPEDVTSIGSSAFSSCSGLTSVTIPESVTSIDSAAFSGCDKLKHVYYGGSDLQWKEIEIGNYNYNLTDAIIHYASTHAHNVEHVPEKAASCTETGNLEYWLCSICGKYFTDETFTKSTDEAGVTLPALGHALTLKKAVKPTHKTAGNIEYYICSRCEKLFKDALGTEETTLEEVTLPMISYVTEIILTRDGELVPETMEVDGRTSRTLSFAVMVQPAGAETKVEWSSSVPAVARMNQSGIVTLLTSGTTVITAAATDGSEVTAQVTLNVTAPDYAPRLGASTLTLNSVSCAGVSVDLVESYGNQILSVSVDDERFDVEYADSLLTLTSREAVARGTYRMTLEAVCDDGRTYSYPITVRVIQTLPRLTVRQSQRFNLFYRDSQAALTITGGEVESAELTGNSDFVLENEDGEWVIRYADPENAPAKPSTRATLSVSFAGYNIPVTRALTIGTVNTAPKLKLNPTSSTLNTALNSDWSVETVLSGADGESLYAYTDTPGVDVALSGNVLTLTLTEAKNVSANVYVQDDNWTKPVKLTHRVTVTNRLPTLRAAAGTLKLNSWFPSETASTGMILSQGNVSLTDVELTPAAREGTAARAESDKLNVYYDADSGEIVAEIADSGIKNGTYSFACTGILESGTEISGGTVRVTVSNTLPRARLSVAMVRLNRRLAGEESIAVKVTLTGGDGYAIEGFEELPDCLDYADGILTATIPNADFTGGSYVLNAIVSRNGETATLPAGVILRVQVYDRAPSFRLTAKGKLDVLNPVSEIIYTPRLTNAQGNVTDIRLEGADAELFTAEVVDGVVHLTMAKGCTYSTRTTYKVIPVLTFCGQEVTGSTLSIRVTQSVLRLAALPNRTVYQSQTAPLVQVLSITSPATAEFGEITLNSRSTAALRNAVEAAGGIEVSGGVVRFPAKAFASLKPGRYTVILDVTPENAAADAKPIQARFTLTVQK
jgi:DNA-directed RNA polymerase subunit RPC12/RpoP